MIARFWHGAVPAAKVDEYMRYHPTKRDMNGPLFRGNRKDERMPLGTRATAEFLGTFCHIGRGQEGRKQSGSRGPGAHPEALKAPASGRALRTGVGRALAAGLFVLSFLRSSGSAEMPEGAVSTDGRFVVSDAMIPMRDGVRLHTKIFKPKDSAGPLPIILQRTPYGVEDADGSFKSYLRALAEDGYVFACQDIRGKFGFRAATHRMYRSPSRASHLEIPVAVAPAGLVP